jgi:hypothetical protein
MEDCMTTTRQPSAHPRWDAFTSSFKQSNYITDFWNWFMTLMSKAAEMVLFGTVLYSGYQLLPGVPHVPASVDAAVFVVQQGALDIGGMGLLKLAKRAGLPKEAFPVRLGMALVVLMILNVALASIKHTLPMIPGEVFVGIETILLIARAIVAVLFGHAIHALREEYSESTITVKEANELQQSMEALSSELARIQRDFQQRIEQQTNLLVTRQETALTAVKQEVQTTIASLTPERLITSLTGHIETLLQERINVSLAEMRQISTPKVSPETSNIRILTPEKVSRRTVRPESETVRDDTNISRIYALLNEDRNRKPAEIQRLTGIPKATVYRLVERYHRENSVIEAGTMNETETASDEEMRGETETAS